MIKKNKFFFNIIANNNVINNIIIFELIENKNIVLLKLFKYLFKKLLVSFNVEMNFCKIKYFEILINKLNIENNSEVIDNTLDIIILLLDKNDFIKLFKKENNLEKCINIKIINVLYEILNETIDLNFLIIKSILNIFTIILKTFFFIIRYKHKNKRK